MKTLPSELHRWTCHLTKYHNTTVINICLYSLFFLVSEQLLFVSELLLSGFCVFLVSGLSGIVFMLASSGPPSPPSIRPAAAASVFFFFSLSQKSRKAQELMLPLVTVVLSISNSPSLSSLHHHSCFAGYPLH